MASMNIYIPDALKRRMDAVEGVNWSPLACRAFEIKLAELITKRGAKDMDDVVARLKALKANTDDELTKAGREHGRAWASNTADKPELELLAAHMKARGGECDRSFRAEVEWGFRSARSVRFCHSARIA